MQNGPFYKIGFSRTGRSIKSDFLERAVLEIRLLEEGDFAELEVQGFSRHPQNFKVWEFVFKTACSGKGEILKQPTPGPTRVQDEVPRAPPPKTR